MAGCRIVIQARTSSSRLPAKALLPVAGMASASLCALRAANRGADVVVATSDHASDDLLAAELGRCGIKVFRGSLTNVLERFSAAIEDLDDADVVVRLTADNVVPDGSFIELMLQRFEAAGIDYLATCSPQDGLPYGLSAEVFKVAVLRQAARNAVDQYDREHVTPWIRRHALCKQVDHVELGLTHSQDHLRCTIDTLDDYVRVAALFERVRGQAVLAGWAELVGALANIPDAPRFRIPYRVASNGRVCGLVTLGTVQFGLAYGIANQDGMPDDRMLAEIFRIAIEQGVTDIDTARAYGVSEYRIGAVGGTELASRTRILTKLDPLKDLPEDASREQVRAAVDASVFASCRNLRTTRLDVLMLHRWAHRRACGGAIWGRLQELREEGVVGLLGVSLSTPDEAVEALGDPDIAHVQLPCNVLDWRWESNAAFHELRRRRADVSIHVRSAFLQGLLLSPSSAWPVDIVDAEDVGRRLDQVVAELGRASRAELCLAYLAGLDWVDSIVIGVDNAAQLKANLALSGCEPLSASERMRMRQLLGNVPERMLNPALWFGQPAPSA